MKSVLIFIFGVILTMATYRYFINLHDPIEVDCKIQLRSLSEKISKYKKFCGVFPMESEGLKALVSPKSFGCELEPILEKVPLDPWDGDFIYLLKNENVYLLSSKAECGYEVAK